MDDRTPRDINFPSSIFHFQIDYGKDQTHQRRTQAPARQPQAVPALSPDAVTQETAASDEDPRGAPASRRSDRRFEREARTGRAVDRSSGGFFGGHPRVGQTAECFLLDSPH